MRALLAIVPVFLAVWVTAQSDTLWSVTRVKMYYDSTLFEVDSGRTVKGVKTGEWKRYQYSTRGNPRRIVQYLAFEGGLPREQKHYTYSPNGSWQYSWYTLDEKGRLLVERYFIDDRLLWERFTKEGGRYAKYYYPDGKPEAEGFEKARVLRSGCDAGLTVYDKSGRWTYYTEKGKRKILKKNHRPVLNER